MSQGAATDTVAFVDAVRARQVAARHTGSLVLGVHAVAVAALAAMHVGRRQGLDFWQYLVPCAVYLALWVAVRLRASRTGMGASRDRFGVAVALAVAVCVPFSLVVAVLTGAGAVLGLGLVVFGTRLRLSALWLSGLGLIALSPLVQLGVVDNHARLLGPEPGTVLLGLAALGLAVLAVTAARTERATLRLPPP